MKPSHEKTARLGKKQLGNYRDFVGVQKYYDRIGASQFSLLTALGLREHHSLIDIGCGSLRAGRLFIVYLLPGHYFGIEPERRLLKKGLKSELGYEIVRIRKPTFCHDKKFTLTLLRNEFDYLLAHSIFTHAPANQIARCLQQARKVMTRNSILAATFNEEEANYQGDEWIYPRAIGYTRKFMSRLVREAGLECRHFEWPNPTNQKWMVITDPSNEPHIPKFGVGANFGHWGATESPESPRQNHNPPPANHSE